MKSEARISGTKGVSLGGFDLAVNGERTGGKIRDGGGEKKGVNLQILTVVGFVQPGVLQKGCKYTVDVELY